MATSEHAEVERKYESSGDVQHSLDDVLGDVRSVEVRGAPVVTTLDATYFDTADLALLRYRITLRRRSGGDDEGWHLKLPVDDDERRELHRPLGRSTRTPPKALLDEVRAYLRGRPLVPVARLVTDRTERRLVSAGAAEPVAVVAEDRVRAEVTVGTSSVQEWSEVEVELVDGRTRDLDAVEKALKAAGFRRASWPSKLARALGDRVPATRPVAARRVGRKSVAGEVLLGHLDAQIAELFARDAGARVDAPDAVHKMRVATRRLRSALATFRPLLDESKSEPIRDELKWLGAHLGGPRDAEVQREGLLELLDRQPAAHLMGPVRRRVGVEMKSRHDAAHGDLVGALESARYRRLLARLDGLLEHPPLSDRAEQPAHEEVRALTKRAAHRFDKAVRAARSASTPDELDVALHDVRKAAKRARYAAEVATAVGGKRADRLAQRMEAVQEVLGEHQDAVVARVLLRELALTAQDAGENAFTYGVLHGAEHERARLARIGYDDVLGAAQRPKVRDWLDD